MREIKFRAWVKEIDDCTGLYMAKVANIDFEKSYK